MARRMFALNDADTTASTGQSAHIAIGGTSRPNVVRPYPKNIRIATKTYTIVITGVENAQPTRGRLCRTGTPRARTSSRSTLTRAGRVRDGGHARETRVRLDVDADVDARARIGGRGRRRSMAAARCGVGAASERGDAAGCERRVITKRRRRIIDKKGRLFINSSRRCLVARSRGGALAREI